MMTDISGSVSGLPRTAVITITSGRHEHLCRQRLGLVGAPVTHVIVGMGEAPPASDPDASPPVIGLQVPATPHGLPLAAARNTGADAALRLEADLLIFLDVDCIPSPNLVAMYAAAAARTHDPALLCGPVSYLPPRPAGGYPEHGLSRLADPHPGRPAPPYGEIVTDSRTELFWSLSFAVTATTWRLLGGFHEGYVGYGAEDTDFALSAARQGSQIYWVGGADAYHQHHSPSYLDPSHLSEIARNANLFHRRHGSWPMRTWIDELASRGALNFDAVAGRLSQSQNCERTGFEPWGSAR
jgi:hypothetical protein